MKAKATKTFRTTSLAILPALLLGMLARTAAAQTNCQYITIKSGNYAVQTNQIITLVGYDWYQLPSIVGSFPDGSTTQMNPYIYQVPEASASGQQGFYAFRPAVFYCPSPLSTQIFTGLTNISISAASATLKIETPQMATVVSNYIPADAIVIPASATGNVQIILESSTDLVSWTAAYPGTYSASSATNRFFRVRAAVGP